MCADAGTPAATSLAAVEAKNAKTATQENQNMTPQKRNYSDAKMVELIAAGEHTDSQIAEQLGVSRTTVWRIRHGVSRPELQPRIDEIINGYIREIRRHAIRQLKAVVDKHIEVAVTDKSETGRKSRDFVINLFLMNMPQMPEQKTKTACPERGFLQLIHELSPELKDRILEELDIPRMDSADEVPYNGY